MSTSIFEINAEAYWSSGVIAQAAWLAVFSLVDGTIFTVTEELVRDASLHT